MLDIKLIRSNPEQIKAGAKKRCIDVDALVDDILKIDEERRVVTGKVENMKAEQNAATKQIPVLKKAGQDASQLMAEMKTLSDKIKQCDAELSELEEKQKSLLLSLPNMPDEDLEAGGKENNKPIHYFKEQPKFDFEPKNHVDLCEALGMIDYQRGAKLAGAGSWIYRGWGSRLECVR